MSVTHLDRSKGSKPRCHEALIHLADRFSDWFEGLASCNDPDGEATLTGSLPDQAALFGVPARIHNVNLILVSVHRLPIVNEIESPGSNQQAT